MHMTDDTSDSEFASLGEVAAELGLEPTAVLPAARRSVEVGAGQQVSALIWGDAAPELVFLHGGGQNAYTWDLVITAHGRPAIAIDLPGHGHSSWREDRDYRPAANAAAVARAISELAPAAAGIIGMSQGGLTLIRLAATRPELVRRAMIVDVTPGSAAAHARMSRSERGTTQLITEHRAFASLDEMTELAVRASARRPVSAVRRGVRHNARQLPDGAWTWRYDPQIGAAQGAHAALWGDVRRLSMPVMLVRGGDSAFVTEDDLARMTRLLPAMRVEVVPGSGHAVQSDQPLRLTALISDFLLPG
jgi:esterase